MTDTETKTPNRRLTALEWDKIVDLYEEGSVTQQQLADRFGVSIVAIQKGLNKRGAVRYARKPDVVDEARKAREEERVALYKEIKDVKKRHRKYNDMLSQITMSRIAKAASSGENYAAYLNDLKSIKLAQGIVNKIRDDNFHLLGMYDENSEIDEVDELNIGVFTEKDVKEIRDKGEDADLLKVYADEIEKLERGESI